MADQRGQRSDIGVARSEATVLVSLEHKPEVLSEPSGEDLTDPDYYEHLDGISAAVKKKPRVIEEHDGISSLLPAIEAGTGVALVAESLGRIAGQRVKLLRLTPEPKPVIIGIAAPEGRLTPAAEKFWQCAKQAAAAAANSRR